MVVEVDVCDQERSGKDEARKKVAMLISVSRECSDRRRVVSDRLFGALLGG
jgi:hypothetical protein